MKVLADIISAPADGDKMSSLAMRNTTKLGEYNSEAFKLPDNSNSSP